MHDEVLRREIAQDIEIDLCRAWDNPPYVSVDDFTIKDSPRMRWHQRMPQAWEAADDAERIDLSIEYRRVAKLENQLVAAGLNPAILGTDRDPRAHCRTTETPEAVGLPYVPRAAGYDASPSSLSAAAMAPDQEFQLQQRMLASYRSRGHW